MLALRLAWRNLRRNRRRTAIETASIAGAVFLAVTFNNLNGGSYEQMVSSGVRTGSGHIGFYHPGYLQERRLSQTFAADPLLEQLRARPDVVQAAARLYVPGLIRSSRANRPAALLGLDIERERGENPLLKPRVVVAGSLDDVATTGRTVRVAVGDELARRLDVDIGGKLVWTSPDAAGTMQSAMVRVAAIVHTGMREVDAATVLAPRAAVAQWLKRPGAAHELMVLLPGVDDIAAVMPDFAYLAQRQSDVAAYPWWEAMPALHDGIAADRGSNRVIVAFIYFLVGIGTINTLLMSVMERSREFGVMRALGVDRRGIRRMVVAEAVVLGAAAIALGELLATAATLYLSRVGIDLSALWSGDIDFAGAILDPVIHATWDIGAMSGFAAIMFVIVLLASLYPAGVALKARPADAMRRH